MSILDKVKNPRENGNENSFDCDYNHARLGWIPFTAQPGNDETAAVVYHLINDGLLGEIAPMPEPDWSLVFEQEKQTRLDAAQLSNQQYDMLSDEQKTELQDYYASLDALAFSGDTEFTAWPAKPEFL